MEATEVEARFSADGKISPLSFTWRGQRHAVSSRGRQWGDGAGLHFLVMDNTDRVFELMYAPNTGLWHIVRSPNERLSV
jgi:hypothetical protein